jgi:hypothetical protein
MIEDPTHLHIKEDEDIKPFIFDGEQDAPLRFLSSGREGVDPAKSFA